MENRFGFKDLIPVVLLLVLIGVGAMSWRAAVRQANEIGEIVAQMEKMQVDVQRLQDKIANLQTRLDSDAEAAEAAAASTDIPAEPGPTVATGGLLDVMD